MSRLLGPPRSVRRWLLLLGIYSGLVLLGLRVDAARTLAFLIDAGEFGFGFLWTSAVLVWACAFLRYRWKCNVNYLWREAGRPPVPWRPADVPRWALIFGNPWEGVNKQ